MKKEFGLLLFIRIISETNMVWSMSAEQRLYKDLLKNYNKHIRPVIFANNTVNITMDIQPYSIMDTNEAAETIQVTQWLSMDWTDEFLTWNPDEYEGINMTRLYLNEVWTPDLVCYGTVSSFYVLPEDKTLVKLWFNGYISTFINQILTVHCKFDVTKFPFDKQSCYFHYGSWMQNGEALVIKPKSTSGNIDQYQKSRQWYLTDFYAEEKVKHYASAVAPYYEVYYYLVITRKPTYYILTIIIPSYVITTLSLVGIFSPFNNLGERQEKVTLGLTTLLAMAVVLLMITEQMPKTSNGLPFIGVFLMLELMVTTISCCLAACIMYIHRRALYNKKVPRFLRRLFCLSMKKVEPKTSTISTTNLLTRTYAETNGGGPILQGRHFWLEFHHNNQKPTPTKNDHNEIQNLAVMVNKCIEMTQKLGEKLNEEGGMSDTEFEWLQICDRLDVIGLYFMLIANTALIFIIYLIMV